MNQRGNWLSFAIFSLLTLRSSGLKMTSDSYEAFGEKGGTTELICKADEIPDTCKFNRPDGQLICPTGNEEVVYYDDGNCVDDPAVELARDMDQCRLIIRGIDPDVHMGEWSCSIEVWNEKAKAKINVQQPLPSVVEFFNIWQDVVVNIGKSKEKVFQCGVFNPNDKFTPLKSNPGEMTWKLKDKVISKSNKYEKDDKKNFMQKITLTPSVNDNGAKLTCSLKSGPSSTITLYVVELDYIAPEDEIFVDNDLDELVIVQKFTANPPPKPFQIFWETYEGNNPVRIFAGKSYGPYTADALKPLGGNKYSVTLRIEEPAKLRNKDLKMRLSIKVGQGVRNDFIDLPFKLFYPPKDPKEVAPEPEAEPEPAEDINETDDGDSEKKEEMKNPSASLYIIVAIIALVLVLCAVFYCCKRGGSEDQHVPTPRSPKDAEEGKPLVKNIDQPDSRAGTSPGPSIPPNAEQQLIDKLEPKTSIQKPARAPESINQHLKRERFAKTGATKAEDEHREIEKMANTIRSYDDDDDDDVTAAVYRKPEVKKEEAGYFKSVPLTAEEKRKFHRRSQDRTSSEESNGSIDKNGLPYPLRPPQLSNDREEQNNQDTLPIHKKEWKTNPLFTESSNRQENGSSKSEDSEEEKPIATKKAEPEKPVSSIPSKAVEPEKPASSAQYKADEPEKPVSTVQPTPVEPEIAAPSAQHKADEPEKTVSTVKPSPVEPKKPVSAAHTNAGEPEKPFSAAQSKAGEPEKPAPTALSKAAEPEKPISTVQPTPAEAEKQLPASKSFDHAAQVEPVKAKAPTPPVQLPEVENKHKEEPRRSVTKAPALPANLVKSAKHYEDSKPANLELNTGNKVYKSSLQVELSPVSKPVSASNLFDQPSHISDGSQITSTPKSIATQTPPIGKRFDLDNSELRPVEETNGNRSSTDEKSSEADQSHCW